MAFINPLTRGQTPLYDVTAEGGFTDVSPIAKAARSFERIAGSRSASVLDKLMAMLLSSEPTFGVHNLVGSFLPEDKPAFSLRHGRNPRLPE